MLTITDVRTVLLTGPCTNDRFILEVRKLRSAAFVEIHTNMGTVGVGETYAGYFCPEIVPEIVAFFGPILVGQKLDPAAPVGPQIAELWRRMFHCGNFWCRVGVGAITLTAIEAALWDLAGKALGKPVHELLGGAKHQRLKAYATGGPSNYPKARLAEKVDYYAGLGFRAFKVGAGKVEDGRFDDGGTDAASVAAFEGDKAAFLRKHVGPGVDILFDGHMGNSPVGVWDLKTAAAVMEAVRPHGLFFFEEPLPYSDAAAYAELAAGTDVPIAGGECLSTMSEWREYLRRDSFDIAQPDASYVGGLGEFMRIAAALEARGKRIATHAWGAAGSLMQNIHAGFAAGNTCILEVPPDFAGLHKEIMGDSFQMKDGHILPPTTPGLGLTLSDAVKSRYAFVPGTGEFNSVPGKILST